MQRSGSPVMKKESAGTLHIQKLWDAEPPTFLPPGSMYSRLHSCFVQDTAGTSFMSLETLRSGAFKSATAGSRTRAAGLEGQNPDR